MFDGKIEKRAVIVGVSVEPYGLCRTDDNLQCFL
jgi:hypothetical protein